MIRHNILTVDEVAELSGVSSTMIRYYIRTHKLKAMQVRRSPKSPPDRIVHMIMRSEAESWIRSRERRIKIAAEKRSSQVAAQPQAHIVSVT